MDESGQKAAPRWTHSAIFTNASEAARREVELFVSQAEGLNRSVYWLFTISSALLIWSRQMTGLPGDLRWWQVTALLSMGILPLVSLIHGRFSSYARKLMITFYREQLIQDLEGRSDDQRALSISEGLDLINRVFGSLVDTGSCSVPSSNRVGLLRSWSLIRRLFIGQVLLVLCSIIGSIFAK